MKRIEIGEFPELFLGANRWIDVRAPIEFGVGTVPGAVNLPLLSDDERHQIGIVYKSQGQAAAIELGHRLVSGAVREERTASWMNELEAHPDAIIFCFRGGLRSQTVQSWLREAGISAPIVEGGYKALRHFFLETIESISRTLKFEVVDGPTGSGKTDHMKSSGRRFLDLEGLAKHRGSAFGTLDEPQPSQVDFENQLAIQLMKLARHDEPVLIENESRLIGRCSIPMVLFDVMRSSPKIILDVPLEARVENVFVDYILKSRLGTSNDPAKFDDFRNSVRSISRKLGGARTQEVLNDLDFSATEFKAGRGLASNRVWIRKLIEWYYDPAYRR